MEYSVVDKFHYWIRERENIRVRKEVLQSTTPYTDDPVFQTTYFCNVRREDDKVTRWIRGNYFPAEGLCSTDATPNMMMARFVNKPESLLKLDWPWGEFHLDLWSKVMSQEGAWGGAYIVSTNGRRMAKHEYIGGLLDGAWRHFEQHPLPSTPPTLAGAHRAIQALDGMGSFMAAQVVADLKNTKGHPLADAADWHTWSSHGPGSLRGLAWYHGVDKITPSQYTTSIQEAWERLPKELQKRVQCMQNLQNCFCEFDKYMRVSTGTGRSKRKYNGS